MPAVTRRLAFGLAGLSAAVVAVSACTPTASVQFQTVRPSDESRATITAEPAGPKKVDPAKQIRVLAQDGQLADVRVTGPSGTVAGELSADGTTWTAASQALEFGSRYTVEATAVDPRGVPTTQTSEFRTLKPKAFLSGTVQPGEGATVGVGMPITVTFDSEVKDREAVEQALVIYTPEPLLGAWSWNGPTQVQFRPQKYWPGNIDVTVALNLDGVKAAKRVYGDANTQTTFRIGPRMVTKVDAQSHSAAVFRDGEKIRTMPITTGKLGFETRSGVKVVVSKERTRIMDAATGGTEESDPEYYRLEVEYAMRVTYSGEFLHAAPWSVGSQGYANVSHGCVGMSTDNAAWLYGQTNVGDVVEVTGTSAVQNLGNGITVWNEPWEQWLEGSTTGPVLTVPAPVASTPETPETSENAGTPSEDAPVEGDSTTPVTQTSYGR